MTNLNFEAAKEWIAQFESVSHPVPEAIRAALDAAIAAQRGSGDVAGWRDISTAPKDGTAVLVYNGKVGKGYYFKGKDGSHGWILSKVDPDFDDWFGNSITLWRPFPAPPTTGGTHE